MTEFGRDYAGVYDLLYGAKDYAAEVDLIERILTRHGMPGARNILDLGCGTGNHALPLALRGHAVTAIDRSGPMLARARAKVAAHAANGSPVPEFLESDIGDFDLKKRFDAALMMFTVLGYQREDAELASSLRAVHRHLEPGGLFLFDVWNGLAVLAQRPRERSVRAQDGDASIVRRSKARLDEAKRLCHVRFDLERSSGEGTASWVEEHVVRYFFPDELGSELARHGLRLLELKRFPDGEAPPDEHAWNVIGVARAE
jgi:SAM-dependent methyltransferase